MIEISRTLSRTWRRLCLAFGLVCLLSAVSVADPMSTPSKFDASACLPTQMPSRDALFSSPRKVFAHYFNRFPLSLDNKDASHDYYATEYLRPTGEQSKWMAEGGFLRTRPIPVRAGPSQNYVIDNLKREVELAISRGITGFTFDILSLSDIEPGSYLPNMLKAASEVDPRFQIVLMPDMAAFGQNVERVKAIIKTVYREPGLFHLPDGRLVVAPFMSEQVSPAAWDTMNAQLAADGMQIAFVPTFLNTKYVPEYASVAAGFGTFGTPLPIQRAIVRAGVATAHAERKPFMAGISGQGYRPKEYRYWEAQGSLAYRDSWLGAIEGGADWVQLTTWNDFSESTQIIPYADAEGSSGTGYFNLTGYYATWFLTGKPPPITHDVLYYFYRKQTVDGKASKAGQQMRNAVLFQPGKDMIELVGFLTEPGSLSISIGGRDYVKAVGSGVQSLSAPLGSGVPRFSFLRGNKAVISFNGTTAIDSGPDAPGGYADLTYWSGSASAKGTCFSSAIQ
jgi:hypothetical protein